MARAAGFLLLAVAAMCVSPGALAGPALVDKNGNPAPMDKGAKASGPAPVTAGTNTTHPALVDKDGRSPAEVAAQAAAALLPAAKPEVKPTHTASSSDR